MAAFSSLFRWNNTRLYARNNPVHRFPTRKMCPVPLKAPGGEGGTSPYHVYRYVPLQRVWFLSRFGLKIFGIHFVICGRFFENFRKVTVGSVSRHRPSIYRPSSGRNVHSVDISSECWSDLVRYHTEYRSRASRLSANRCVGRYGLVSSTLGWYLSILYR